MGKFSFDAVEIIDLKVTSIGKTIFLFVTFIVWRHFVNCWFFLLENDSWVSSISFEKDRKKIVKVGIIKVKTWTGLAAWTQNNDYVLIGLPIEFIIMCRGGKSGGWEHVQWKLLRRRFCDSMGVPRGWGLIKPAKKWK